MDKAVKEYLLELGRIAVIAAIPVVIVAIQDGVDGRTIFLLAIVAILKAIDKALHKSGIAEKGLTQF